MNFVKRTRKQNRKELIKFEFRTSSNDHKKEPIRESFGPRKTNVEIEKIEKNLSIENKDFG